MDKHLSEAMDTPGRATASPRDFLHVLFKRKIQTLLFFGATVCAVAIGTAITKPTCETISQILIKVGKEDIYLQTVPTSGNLNPVFRFNREEQVNSEPQIKEKETLIKYTKQGRLVRNVRDKIQMLREKLAEHETKRYGKSRSGLNVTSPPQRWDNCYVMHPILSKIYGTQAQRCS